MIEPLLMPLVRAVNTALETDPATLNKLARLEGQIYAVHSTLPPLTLCFRLHGTGVELVDDEQNAKVRLRGSALALVRLLASAASEESGLGQSDVEISGDATALLQLSRAFADLEVDWEELLSRLLGDVAARAITQSLEQVRQFERRNRDQVLGNLREFAHDSLGLIGPGEVRNLSVRSRELQYRIDRLEARIKGAEQIGSKRAD